MSQRIGVQGSGLQNLRAAGSASSPRAHAGPPSPHTPGKQPLTSQLDVATQRHTDDIGRPSHATQPAPRAAHPDAPQGAPRSPGPSYLAHLHRSFGRSDR